MSGDKISRRRFLTTMAGAAVAVSFKSEAARACAKSDIGLALGGGAIMGALYSSGHSAKDIRELISAWMSTESGNWSRAMVSMNIFKWIDLIDPGLRKDGLVNTDRFLGFPHQAIKQSTFAQTKIPLQDRGDGPLERHTGRL